MQTWSPFVRKPGTQFPPSSRLCETFQRIALRTEGWLTEGRRPALVPSETSITDLNLFELSKRHPRSVFVRRFTQFDEHTNGSDWEWCIGARSSWYRMRIQAKKLDNFGRHYDCLDDVLDQKTGPAELQITRLIRTAGSMPAIYCLYNGEPDPVLAVRWDIPCDPAGMWLHGCSIASASALEPLVKAGKKGIVDIAPLSRPWSDLVCCPKGTDIATRVQSVCSGLGEREGQEPGQLLGQIDRQPPEWAVRLREGSGDLGIPLAGHPDGVVLIDLSDENSR